jgi:HPr kinase/phosphorylase
MSSDPLVHASCVARFGRGVLIRGASGAGKSSLALQLMAGGWMLVADDYVALAAVAGQVFASAPDRLRGLVEIYGVGILPVPARLKVPIHLLVDLVAEAPERLPLPQPEVLLGCAIPTQILPARHQMNAFYVAEALRHTPLSG